MRPRLLKFFLVSLLLSALGQSSQLVLFIYLTPTLPTSANSLPPGQYRFFSYSVASFVSFLISPVLLFVAFYQLGKKLDLRRDYKAVAVNLFMGGMIGNSLSYFLVPVLLTGTQWEASFSDVLSLILTIFSGLMLFVEFGLSMVFSGFFALTIAYFRQHHPTVNTDKK